MDHLASVEGVKTKAPKEMQIKPAESETKVKTFIASSPVSPPTAGNRLVRKL